MYAQRAANSPAFVPVFQLHTNFRPKNNHMPEINKLATVGTAMSPSLAKQGVKAPRHGALGRYPSHALAVVGLRSTALQWSMAQAPEARGIVHWTVAAAFPFSPGKWPLHNRPPQFGMLGSAPNHRTGLCSPQAAA